MRVVGVVTEYNPFHNGHIYHLEQARKVAHADIVVAIMSGNFVQRGEAAIFDKWQRANAALHHGADVVMELPFYMAVQPAHLFAQGALQLLSAMNIDTMVFGAEHPDVDFDALVQVDIEDPEGFKTFNRTYATQFNEQLVKATGFQLDQPNDILSYGYARANRQLTRPLTLVPIARRGSDYHATDINQSGFSSASAIRQALLEDNSTVDVSLAIPKETQSSIEEVQPQQGWSDAMWQMLRHQLVMTPVEELAKIYQMSEGLEYRLKEAAEQNATWDDFMTAAKTKRYTYSRLQRVFLYTLMHATEVEMTSEHDNYLRLLGFTTAGQEYLSSVKKQFSLPLITRFNQKLKEKQLNLDYRAGMLYEMLSGQPQDFRHNPLKVQE